MFVQAESEALQTLPSRGWAVMSELVGHASAVTTVTAEVVADPGGVPGAIRRSAEVVGGVLERLAACRERLEQMLNAVRPDPWLAGVFASREQFSRIALVLAGLADSSSLPPELVAVIAHADQLDVDRGWMNAQSIEVRMQFLALVSLRWLPELNAVGATNCLQGVLRNFQSLGVGEPDSFASLVDAVILVSFQQGIARIVHPGTRPDDEAGADQWQAFFDHRRAAEGAAWDEASFRLWASAEQSATEAGYQWAVDQGVTVTRDLALMTQGAEIYRWANRQRGRSSDPVRAIGRLLDGITGAPTLGIDVLSGGTWSRARHRRIDAMQTELAWALDPRNPDFTYEAAQLIAAGSSVGPTVYAEPVVTAAHVQQQSARDRAMLDEAADTLAKFDDAAGSVCDQLPSSIPGCRT